MTHVLIVDDNLQNLYMLRALLQGHGYAVEEARHGAEALAKARLALPDLIISDLLMPVMDGYTLLRHWKTDERLNNVPFIVYTATYTDARDERLALALGADSFLLKPAEPEVFIAHAQAALTVREPARPTPATEWPPESQGESVLSDYNEVLVRKLEAKAIDLERSNRELQATLAHGKQTQVALQESEEQFRATFEQAAVGIAHVDVDGRLARVNQKLCEITARSREELLRLTTFDLGMPEDRAAADAARLAMLAGTQRQYATEKRYRKGNEAIWVSTVSTLLRDGDGAPRYFILVASDISERMLLQEQLRQTQKLETIGQLTSGIAHDFNNLLTVIIGNAELLVERLGGQADLQTLAEMTRSAASRGADLTQRLLAFARRQALDPRAVDVNVLLHGMDGMLRRMLPEDIEIQFVRGVGLWPALVDPSQLELAVLNLGINARDAMPGGGRLTVETANVFVDEAYANEQSELNPGPYVRVGVSDTGTGIAAAHLARVFDPFFTTKAAGKGTGLGLSMVYGFVKQSQGHVNIYSEPGHGTSVKLYLPRASGPEAEAKLVEQTVSATELRGSESILLVEDDDLVRRYAEQQLLGLGYRVVCASDGAGALALLHQRTDIELLFTDVTMPGDMNGQQLADAATALRPGLKVLFSSGYADNAIVHHGRVDRGVHLLGKPYGRIELGRKIRAVLSPPGGVTAPTASPSSPGRLLVLDDDAMVGKILVMAAKRMGLEAELLHEPDAFFERVTQWNPSHVVIDLSMPKMGGLEVLGGLARIGCVARVVVCSGQDAGRINAALDHARGLGLEIGGALAKPFSVTALRSLLSAAPPG